MFAVQDPISILVLICGSRMCPWAKSIENNFSRGRWLTLCP